MRPNPAYRAAVARRDLPARLSETRIPAHLQDHSIEALYTGVRKGKVRNKPASEMWSSLSPYYSNSVTIDKRWSQTAKDQNS